MGISNSKRRKAIEKLFEIEESNNVPKEYRLTYDMYEGIDMFSEPEPCKKPYVDIRDVVARVNNYHSRR